MSVKQINAGLRIGAMLIDHIVMSFIIMIIALPVLFSGFNDSFFEDSIDSTSNIDWMLYIMIFGMSLYFNKDLIQGKSIAKRVLKQEVVNVKTNEIASPIKCLIRNLTIAVWPIEVIAVLINPSRRIGDFIAGTRVDCITDERDSKPKIDLKNVTISVVLGFLILFTSSFLFKGKIGNGAFDNPNYVESSYNKELSSRFENRLNDTHPEYLLDSHVKVFDTIENDSLKYISAIFYLTQNYIDHDSQFDKVKNDKSFGVFNSLFRYAPQRIEHSKKHTQKVRIYNCEKLGKLNLLFTGRDFLFMITEYSIFAA